MSTGGNGSEVDLAFPLSPPRIPAASSESPKSSPDLGTTVEDVEDSVEVPESLRKPVYKQRRGGLGLHVKTGGSSTSLASGTTPTSAGSGLTTTVAWSPSMSPRSVGRVQMPAPATWESIPEGDPAAVREGRASMAETEFTDVSNEADEEAWIDPRAQGARISARGSTSGEPARGSAPRPTIVSYRSSGAFPTEDVQPTSPIRGDIPFGMYGDKNSPVIHWRMGEDGNIEEEAQGKETESPSGLGDAGQSGWESLNAITNGNQDGGSGGIAGFSRASGRRRGPPSGLTMTNQSTQ
ncbi:hypothetical protein L198_07104 [Cryptococcus wingfieldii CBS 7118]|uniref:Uncharacterized protein n=1 Tax=Cryptococcus wingfieldii CBS 7118 TaxID=1295528 RepID=A0A1E3IEP6_9TREE|nr:hypothetical protein L198_07104 [Cryptococcus wingfieldii CBS 7118]ODN87102.1 hypothetical protein L198_07104 [Cryptococcus wingfieldii CBS 7118]